MADQLPGRCNVLVIGGGLAGSMSAVLLAREGVDVVVIDQRRSSEGDRGELLFLPELPIHRFSGLDRKLAAIGASGRSGISQNDSTDSLEPGSVRAGLRLIADLQNYRLSRYEISSLQLEHAAQQGATIFMETRITMVECEGNRPVAVLWSSGEAAGKITFDHLIDASGPSGILASSYLKNLRHHRVIGRRFRGYDLSRKFEPDALVLEALSDGSGWMWYVPLDDGSINVGLVIDRHAYARLKRANAADAERVFEAVLELCPKAMRLLEPAAAVADALEWRDDEIVPDSFAGPYFRLTDEASGAPGSLFSGGLHLAILSALSAAATICAVIRGDVDESRASRFHDLCVRRGYTRFVLAERLNLEVHRIYSRRAVADMLARRDLLRDYEDTRPEGAIDGLFIRMRRGQLGLEPTNIMGRFMSWIRRQVMARGSVATNPEPSKD